MTALGWPPVPQTLVTKPFNWNFGYSYFQVTNAQSSPTPANFQQLIQLPSSLSLSAFPLRFYSDSALTRPLYAWYETKTGVWVLLPDGIGANSSVNVYAAPGTPDGVYTGMNPLLSPTYGSLDNGATVFPTLYDNFAGTSLKTGLWSVSGFTTSVGSYTVNNGFSSTTTASNNVMLLSVNTYSYPAYFEAYIAGFGSTGSTEADNFWFGNAATAIGSNTTSQMLGVPGSTTLVVQTSSSLANTQDGSATISNSSGNHVYGLSQDGVNAIAWFDYNAAVTYPESFIPTGIPFAPALNHVSGLTMPTLYWTRIRAYPPSGVMPSVSVV